MDRNKWVLNCLCSELDLIESKGSATVNTALLRSYINQLKKQAVFVEEKLAQETALEDAAMNQLGKGMRRAGFPSGIYHI